MQVFIVLYYIFVFLENMRSQCSSEKCSGSATSGRTRSNVLAERLLLWFLPWLAKLFHINKKKTYTTLQRQCIFCQSVQNIAGSTWFGL